MFVVEANNHIIRDENGVAWIARTKVKVIEVALDHLAYGWGAEELNRHHPHLSLAQIHSALAFYHDHAEEIHRQIEERQQKVAALRAEFGDSPTQVRLRAMLRRR